MVDPADKERLARLDAKIAAAKQAQAPKKAHQDEHYSQANLAWRMVVELVAGLGIGFGIGLGFAAGVKTMLRSAAEIQAKISARAGEDEGD